MVSHIVLIKPREDLSAAERWSLVDALRQAARAIPSVRNVRIGTRLVHGAGYEADALDTADYVAVIDFDDLDGLQAYLRHPAHDELGKRFRQSLRSALVYDFEVGGLEQLEELA